MTEPKHPLLAKVATPPNKRSKWSLYWLFWIFGMVLTGFLIPELHAIFNEQKGDTLSENIRLWLKPETPGGGAAWLSVIVTLIGVLVWLWGHIHNYWP